MNNTDKTSVVKWVLIASGCALLIVGALVYWSLKGQDSEVVDFEKVEDIELVRIPATTETIRIAIASMVTPRAGFAYYRQLLDYIGSEIAKPVEFVIHNNYAETFRLLKINRIDFAFVCGAPYVDSHDTFGLELLVAPQTNGVSTYQSYIIVHKDSTMERLEDLRGKVFAFGDPLCNSGNVVPTYMLAKISETPDTFFERYFYTYAHDKSIKAVAQKTADGAAVDSLIYEYEEEFNPTYTVQTKIIRKSAHYGIPPVVVSKGMDPVVREQVKAILLDIHNDEEGKKILAGMGLEKFVEIDDSAYDGIREMKKFIEKKQLGE